MGDFDSVGTNEFGVFGALFEAKICGWYKFAEDWGSGEDYVYEVKINRYCEVEAPVRI